MPMLTLSHGSGTRTATSCGTVARKTRSGILILLAFALTACGGGGGGGNSAQSASNPKATGTVEVQVITTAGAPLAGASVQLWDGWGGRNGTTAADGQVRFDGVGAGRDGASASVHMAGYRGKASFFTVAPGSVTSVTVPLVSYSVATTVVLGAHPVIANDGRTLILDLDLAVLDANGTPWESLTASDFGLKCIPDPDYFGCGVDSTGQPVTDNYYSASVDAASFSFVPAQTRPTLATAVLLDQSVATGYGFDPSGLRLLAVSDFLTSVTPPDSVALGTYQGTPGTTTTTTYGGFTADTADLRAVVGTLAGKEGGGGGYLLSAVTDMIAFTAANTAAGSSEFQRSVVVVTNTWGSGGWCAGSTECRAAVDASHAAGIPVVAIAEKDTAAIDVAAHSGGAYALLEDPVQLLPVFRALDSIVGHSLAHNRVRFQLESGRPGVFVTGGTVYGLLGINGSPGGIVQIPL
jgi:hypothetical protein